MLEYLTAEVLEQVLKTVAAWLTTRICRRTYPVVERGTRFIKTGGKNLGSRCTKKGQKASRRTRIVLDPPGARTPKL